MYLDVNNVDIHKLPSEWNYGKILEVVLEYPKELHQLNSYQLSAEHLVLLIICHVHKQKNKATNCKLV